jgi:multicomponent Na+:H+ antiporter subunit B
MQRAVEVVVIISLVLVIALLLLLASEYLLPSESIRLLASFYLYATYNPSLPYYTVNSPQAVTAILWDYRGLDTLFETAVFYLAIIAGLALARRLYEESLREGVDLSKSGLSLIVKTVARLTSPMIIAVGASIALHGHLTPGGGFQGGATIAVAPMILIVVFSTLFLIKRGVTSDRMLFIVSLGLIGIGLTAISVFLIGLVVGRFAYVFQNMPKLNSPIGMPATIGNILISGTLWFFNLFEMFAVATGFIIAFVILMLIKGRWEVK